MKRDHTTIDGRIRELGITKVKVCEMVKIHKATLSKIIQGNPNYLNKEKIKEIHKYLDRVRTK
jgi:predicted transcriptional regulator